MSRPPRRIAAYHATVFLSAFLLFQIQPMMAKALLPGFGGSFVVWGACMAFFQALLIGGYAWAHGAQRRLGVRRYAPWHLLVLLAPLLCLGADYAPVARAGAPPYGEIVRLLLAAVGAPFFALATTSLILQRWLADSDLPQRENPYVLYAASNAGSILALLTYPVVVEPLLPLAAQWRAWWAMYILLIPLHILCLPRRRAADPSGDERIFERGARATARQVGLWLTLSMAGCAMLLAATNTITFDVASIPLFWTLPLAVYLSTFVLLFKRRPWNPDWMKRAFGWVVPAAVVIHLIMQLRMTFPLALQLVMQLGILFVVCMRTHGWLAESRPADARLLTAYFLAISVGGFLGSVFVSWVSPMVFTSLVEFPLALALAAAGGALRAAWLPPADGEVRDVRAGLAAAFPALALVSLLLIPWAARQVGLPLEATAALIALPLALAVRGAMKTPAHLTACLLLFALAAPWVEPLAAGTRGVHRLRNFYGIYKVFDQDGIRYLQHGSTTHGGQYLDPARRGVPISYYHPSTPIAELLIENPHDARDIAMIGLGPGALAAYLEPGQRLTIYELDPDNLRVAEEHFTYLKIGRERGGEMTFVFGDGRINLRAAEQDTYDLLIVDAFSSDAIPVHLLTVEALGEYFRALKPDGLLLMHVSNKYVALDPLVASLARELGVLAASKTNLGDVDPDADLTYWAALALGPEALAPLVSGLGWRFMDTGPSASLPRPWTDNYSNLPGLLFAWSSL